MQKCLKCGLPVEGEFCPNCGTKITATTPVQQPQQGQPSPVQGKVVTGAPAKSEFDGSRVMYFLYSILIGMSIILLFIPVPWIICAMGRYTAKHTVISGKRFKFVGTGGSLLGRQLLWSLLLICTLFIYSIVLTGNYVKFFAQNLVLED